MRSLIGRLLNAAAKISSAWPALSQRLAVRAYRLEGGEALRYALALPKTGLALDLGGYQGAFVGELRARFGCRVWTFEPVKPFAAALKRRFAGNAGVQVFAFGLAGEASRPLMRLDGPSTGAAGGGSGKAVRTELRAAEPFLKSRGVKRVDLLKINIEGGEFELLERLTLSPWMGRIGRLQIQFHPHPPGAVKRREEIRRKLAMTHRLEWDFPWIWESWSLKNKDEA